MDNRSEAFKVRNEFMDVCYLPCCSIYSRDFYLKKPYITLDMRMMLLES